MDAKNGESQPSAAGKNTTTIGHKLQDPARAIYGWRLHICMLGLALALFLSALETTIIATALTTIGTHFNDYNKVGWVVTAFLVTNSGFILTYSKLTDIFGQRNILLFALAWFALFSGLCAAAQSMTLTHFILGPILGGVISDTGDWKWIFLLNVPAAGIAGAVLVWSFPKDDMDFGKSVFKRIDFIGSLLSIGSAVLLLYGLQTGGAEHPWSDSRIVGTIVAGGVAVALFFLYEWFIQRHSSAVIEPVMPFRLFKIPRVTFLLLTSFFQGAVFYAVVIVLPQLNQLVHLNSATMAGIRLLPLLLVSSFCSMFSGIALSRTTRYGWYTITTSTILVVLGVGLLVEIPFSEKVLDRYYGYEVIIGVGMGTAVPILMVMGRVEVEDRDNAAMMGAYNTIRTMGGCIAISVCSAILHSEMPKQLDSLPEDVMRSLLASPTTVLPQLEKPVALMVRKTYNDVYRLQLIAVTVFAAAMLVFSVPPLFLSARSMASEKNGEESRERDTQTREEKENAV
ncbi:Efflux pump dotC [Colletotrichum viniferum]|nr:Efflux pump dotC [Colletotrichum viniferum]